MEKARTQVTLDRPIIIGQAILDISKCVMYEAWYETLRPHFAYKNPSNPEVDNRLSLLYCDTDSFVMTIRGLEGKSVFRDIYELQKKTNVLDLSEMQYKPDCGDPHFNPPLLSFEFEGPGSSLAPTRMENAKVLGKFKDEMKGVPIAEFVALRPKMYSLKLAFDVIEPHHNLKKRLKGKTEPKNEVCKKKGIPRNLPAEEDRLAFAHDNYRNVYFGGPTSKVSFPTINKTKKLALYTGIATKAGLAPLDDKSYWFNAAACIRYGHYCIQDFEERLNVLMLQDIHLNDVDKMLDDNLAVASSVKAMEDLRDETVCYDTYLKVFEDSLPDYEVSEFFLDMQVDSPSF